MITPAKGKLAHNPLQKRLITRTRENYAKYERPRQWVVQHGDEQGHNRAPESKLDQAVGGRLLQNSKKDTLE